MSRERTHLSFDDKMCLSVAVKDNQGNTENVKHLTEVFAAKYRKDREIEFFKK